MAPLKSLEREYPIIDSKFQDFCSSHGVFTVEDFLLQDLYILAAYAEQQSNSERLKQGITQVLSVIDGLHRPWVNGLELLADIKHNKPVLSTGFEGIDQLLRGGLRAGQLIELVGPSSSGKTQANYQILQKVMSNILCRSVYDIFSMFDVLNQLECKLKSQKAGSQVKLLIIDSISSLITPILGGSNSQGHALMVSAGYLLKKLAHEHNIAVLVTNHTVGGEGGTPKPALGETWKSIPHVRLMVFRDHGNNSCNITVIKHSSMASGTTASFMIHGS